MNKEQTTDEDISNAMRQDTEEMTVVLEVKARRMIADKWPEMADADPEGIAKMAKQIVFAETILFNLRRKARRVEGHAESVKTKMLAKCIQEMKSDIVSIVDGFLSSRQENKR